jgi:hypothetical protein
MPIEQAMHPYKDIRAISRGNPKNAVMTELKKIGIPTKTRGIHLKTTTYVLTSQDQKETQT